MAYHWILFDLDNTIFDFDRSEEHALRNMLEQYGVSYEESHLELYHNINRRCWRDFEDGRISPERLRTIRFELFLEALGVNDMPVDEVSRQYLSILADTSFLIEGADVLLEKVSDGHRLALVTNGLKEVQRSRLAKSGIGHYFESVVVSDEIGYSKPQADFFDYTFRQIGNPVRTQVLIVGDNLNSDIRGGNQYGLHTCWFNRHGKANDSGVEPTYEIQQLHALNQILETPE